MTLYDMIFQHDNQLSLLFTFLNYMNQKRKWFHVVNVLNENRKPQLPLPVHVIKKSKQTRKLINHVEKSYRKASKNTFGLIFYRLVSVKYIYFMSHQRYPP